MIEQDGDQRVFETGDEHRLVGEGVLVAAHGDKAVALLALTGRVYVVDDQDLEIGPAPGALVIAFFVLVVRQGAFDGGQDIDVAAAVLAAHQRADDAVDDLRQMLELVSLEQGMKVTEDMQAGKCPIGFQRLQFVEYFLGGILVAGAGPGGG